MLHQDYECRNVGEYYTVNTCMVDVRSSYAAVTQPVATNSNHKFHYIIYTILSRGWFGPKHHQAPHDSLQALNFFKALPVYEIAGANAYPVDWNSRTLRIQWLDRKPIGLEQPIPIPTHHEGIQRSL